MIGSPGRLDLDSVNQEILARLHEKGVAVPSSVTLSSDFALRVAITNHRSRKEDFDLLVLEVIRMGKEMVEDRM